MSFSIVLGTNASEPNVLYKDVTDRLTLTGTLKEETDVLDPKIVIEITSTSDLNKFLQCNYFYITAFSRRYFLTGIRSIRNGLWEITGHVDVLSSYASGILGNTALVEKSENEFNRYLNDGTYKAYSNSYIDTYTFPHSFDDWSSAVVMVVSGGRQLV